MEKLKTEINQLKTFSHCKLSQDELKEKYETLEYLNYVIKEGLRIDPPVPSSLFYFAKEDVTI